MVLGLMWVVWGIFHTPHDLGFILTNNLCLFGILIFGSVVLGYAHTSQIYWKIIGGVIYCFYNNEGFILPTGLSNHLFLVHPVLLTISFGSVVVING